MLKRELGLEEEDIIDLPILFKLVAGREGAYRAVAYYPDMVGRRIQLCVNNRCSVRESLS